MAGLGRWFQAVRTFLGFGDAPLSWDQVSTPARFNLHLLTASNSELSMLHPTHSRVMRLNGQQKQH